MSRRLLTIITSLLLVGVVLLLAVLPVRPGAPAPVTGSSLYRSVEDASGSFGSKIDDRSSCRRARRTREWLCEVSEPGGSGGGEYRVRVRPESSCWNGRLGDNDAFGAMPESISACVTGERRSLLDF